MIRDIAHEGWKIFTGAQEWRIHVVQGPRPVFLEDRYLEWRTEGFTKDGVLRIWPVECDEVVEARRRDEAFRRADISPRTQRGPTKPGESYLETMEGTLTDKLREIKRLASVVDMPYAWRAIANGYRIDALRPAIQGAILEVGWQKFHRFVMEWPFIDEWPPGLVEFLEEQKSKKDAQRLKPPPKLRDYRHDDYGTADI